ncbi:FUSC family protein [Desulfosporosinus sp. SYSU MS00001]|uniref:FUSC family protein n=1 Tax=Desulfosporosinus sp. SYSU MS00001 TaxID=3416284 RepID=UPI003CF984A9
MVKINLNFGWRIIKTGIAVMICIWIADLLHFEYPFYSAIAAVIAMQATMADSLNQGINRMKGTIIGAITGYLFALIPFNNPVLIGIGLISTLAILKRMHWNEAMNIASIVFIAIMVNNAGHPLNYSLNRIIDTALGIAVAYLVNRFIYPPHYQIEVERCFQETRIKVINLYQCTFRSLLDQNTCITGNDVRELRETLKEARALVAKKRKDHALSKLQDDFRLKYISPLGRLESMSVAIEQIFSLREKLIHPLSPELEQDLTNLLTKSFYLLSLITEPNMTIAYDLFGETEAVVEDIYLKLGQENSNIYADSNRGYILELLNWIKEVTKATRGCLGISQDLT